MGDLAITVHNLSKQYRITSRQRHDTLRDRIADSFRFRRTRRSGAGQTANGLASGEEWIWALRDVSFKVGQGEVLGIIGRNGAGKSTLLKILSQITEPTEGYAEIRGRIGSLLEVGTGFHPELTGRENVYLNGAILNMKRAEIDRKFTEIVHFAGVEQFIDTPVKRYSSGMKVRLAFAVAAHLDPEILLIDEVLAVGDWEFQKRCLGKMEEVGKAGRTVLLVSHNMTSVLALCPRAILLDAGGIVCDGRASDVVQRYVRPDDRTTMEVRWDDPNDAPGNEKVRLSAVRIRSRDGDLRGAVDIGKPVEIELMFRNLQPGNKLFPVIHVKDHMGGFVFASPNLPSASVTPDPWSGQPLPVGMFRATCEIPANLLNVGTYIVDAAINERVGFSGGAYAEGVLSFEVFDSGEMRKEHLRGSWPGVVRPRLQWSTEYLGMEDQATPTVGQQA